MYCLLLQRRNHALCVVLVFSLLSLAVEKVSPGTNILHVFFSSKLENCNKCFRPHKSLYLTHKCTNNTHTYAFPHIHNTIMKIHMHTHVYMHMFIHIDMCTYMHAHTHECAYATQDPRGRAQPIVSWFPVLHPSSPFAHSMPYQHFPSLSLPTPKPSRGKLSLL